MTLKFQDSRIALIQSLINLHCEVDVKFVPEFLKM